VEGIPPDEGAEGMEKHVEGGDLAKIANPVKTAPTKGTSALGGGRASGRRRGRRHAPLVQKQKERVVGGRNRATQSKVRQK